MRRWFFQRSLVSIKPFTREHVEIVFDEAKRMEKLKSANLLQNKLAACLFYEPSTRTSSSFQAGMLRLGGKVISIKDVKYSSVSKGESLADTVRCLSSYVDVIIMRHYQKGAANEAAKAISIPLVNAGDGTGEHPTQALLDAFTIFKEFGSIDNKVVTIVGDLVNGRTVHSLAYLLSLFRNVTVNLVSPVSLKMSPLEVNELRARPLVVNEHLQLDARLMSETDVLYVTRIQKERFASAAEYKAVRATSGYQITPEVLSSLNAKPTLRIMHPLPRVSEISTAVDSDPRAAYFRQMQNGLWVRMALLNLILNESS
eukprot:TRINITY_DN1228_c0_g1_i1.p1 TRINITY_DN1228_c0_g1~~TRINITY_DN1228_c0_g1_i1.p1  ORF type:complete len:314 (-),score=44.29 TRINITY_DN1228_c0_g1_i1:905-1846(-)